MIYVLSNREYFMSIRSWFRSRRSPRSRRKAGKRSLFRYQRDNPRLRRLQRAAAEDVAAVRQDDKYFDPKSPGNQEPF
jgi:hypothetical protein